MKSTICLKKPSDQKYPCLKACKSDEGELEFVVLFSSSDSGTVVHDPSGTHGIGHYDEKWSEMFFEPFFGQVILEA